MVGGRQVGEKETGKGVKSVVTEGDWTLVVNTQCNIQMTSHRTVHWKPI